MHQDIVIYHSRSLNKDGTKWPLLVDSQDHEKSGIDVSNAYIDITNQHDGCIYEWSSPGFLRLI